MFQQIAFLPPLVLIMTSCSGSSGFNSTAVVPDRKPTKNADMAPSSPTPNPHTNPSPHAEASASPTAAEPSPSPSPSPRSEIIQVDLGSCARNASCLLQGSKPGFYHPLLTTSKPAYTQGEVITMGYNGMRGNSSDWITVVPINYEDNSWCQWFWAGDTSGAYLFKGLPPGRYELRAYYGWKAEGECEVISRKAFDVN